MQGADVGFDPADPITPDTAPRLRTKNLGNLLALDTADLRQCPTEWQKSVYPRRYHHFLNVIHEGIDALEDAKSFASLRQNARQTIVDRFDLRSICLPAHLRLLNMLVPREGRASLAPLRSAASQ